MKKLISVVFGVGLMCAFSGVAIAQEVIAVQEKEAKYDQPSKLENVLYNSSQIARFSAFALDAWTTLRVPTHLQYNYCSNGICRQEERVVIYQEVGFPARFVSRDNLAKGVAVTAVAHVAIYFVTRAMYHRGGAWRKVAIGLNVGLVPGHLAAAVNNLAEGDLSRYAPVGATGIRVW